MPTFRPGDIEEILQLCRTHIDAMHNLQFLLKAKVPKGSDAAGYLDAMENHLQCVTNALCRLPEQ